MKISIGGDHAGFEYKNLLIKSLNDLGYETIDKGPFSNESCDYADFAHPVAESVENKTADFGILICGSANGVAMTANKHQGIRAALCWTAEIANLARTHNDANVLCIPARFVSENDAKEIVSTFLSTSFEGGRHLNRVNKIACK